MMNQVFYSHAGSRAKTMKNLEYSVVRENIIAKILFAYCAAKFTYRENFHVYGIVSHVMKVCEI